MFAGKLMGTLKAPSRLRSHLAIKTPAAAPVRESSRLSVSKGRMRFQRGAPRARRIDISLRRSAARASIMPAMLTQAIRRTIPAKAISTPANPSTGPRSAVPINPGAEIRIRIDAEDVMLSLVRLDAVSANNILPATISAIQENGPNADVQLQLQGAQMIARITRRSFERLSLRPGLRVFAVIKSVTVGGRE